MSDITIKNYIENNLEPIFPNKIKTISLYNALKKFCPNTVKTIQKKLCINFFTRETETKNWYLFILNFLEEKEILGHKSVNNGIYHYATDFYSDYFFHRESSIYNFKNLKNHFILNYNNLTKFFQLCGFLDKKGEEIIKVSLSKEKEISKFEKIFNSKYINYGGIFLFIYSIIRFILLIPQYDKFILLPLFLNICILFIAILILLK